MNINRVKAVIQKDMLEFTKSKYLVSFTILMPLFLSAFMPISFSSMLTEENMAKISEAPFIPKDFDVNNKGLLLNYVFSPLFSIYLLLPLMVSSVLGAYSFVGEKTKRTIEPVLASPISDSELLLGKILAVIIPAIITSYIAIIFSFIILSIIGYTLFKITYAPPLIWIPSLIIAMPVLGLMGVMANVIVSFRVNDIRAAQQLSTIVILPIIAIMISNISGLLVFNELALIIITGLFAAIAVLLFKVSQKMFNRERIVTNW